VTDRATGLRAAIRAVVYETPRHALGCPDDDVCTLFRPLGQQTPCGPDNGCQKWVTCTEPPPEVAAIPRISLLVRIESMVNVGCKFGPNDLSPELWDGLVLLAVERQRMERLIRKQQDTARERERGSPEAQHAVNAMRKADHIPPPGESLFGKSKV